MNYFLAISGFIQNPGAALIFEKKVFTLFLLKEALTFPVFFQMMYSLANVRHGTAVSRFRLLCFSGAMYCSL